jgi:tetratricopeptide (TPR) repeat protein
MDPAAHDAFNRTSIRTALRLIEDAAALERLPLARLRCIRDCAMPLGRALQQLLRRACDSLRPNEGPPQRLSPAWRSYLALHAQYVQGRHAEWIANELALSKASYYRVAGEALDAVLRYVNACERQACASADDALSAPEPTHRKRVELLPIACRGTLIGRQQELRALHNALSPQAGANPSCVGVFGLPGVGKTELLKHIVHDARLREQFDVILWAGLGRRPNIAAILRAWALLLDVPDAQIAGMPGIPELSRLVCAAARDRRTLIVLDDIWNAIDAQPLRVAGEGGAVLFSTRLPEVAIALADARALRIHELSTLNAVDLLRSFAPDVYARHEHRLETLARDLGGMPLALVLAGQFLQETALLGARNRAEHALDRLQQSLFGLPMRDHSAAADGVDPNDRTLSTVIAQLLGVLSPAARAALPALATLLPKPDSFSEEALLAVADITTDVCDELARCGVIEPAGDDRYAMHQLIADYLRQHETRAEHWARLIDVYIGITSRAADCPDRLAPDENNVLDVLRRAAAFGHDDALAALLSAAMPFLDARAQWANTAPLLEHLTRSPRIQARPQVHAEAMLNLAGCSLMMRQHDIALTQARLAVNSAEQIGCDRLLCRALDLLAQAAFETHDIALAAHLAERALAISLRLDAPLLRMDARVTHARTAAARGDLALAQAALQLAESDNDASQAAPQRRLVSAGFAKAWLAIAQFGYFDGQLATADRAARAGLAHARYSDAALEADCTLMLAWLAFNQGDADAARDAARGILTRDHPNATCQPDFSGAHLLLGILAQHVGDVRTMQLHFDRATALLPERRSTSLFSAAMICALAARAFVQAGVLDRALDMLRAAASLASTPLERGVVALVEALYHVETGDARAAAGRLDAARMCVSQTYLAHTALVERELALVQFAVHSAQGDTVASVASARALLTHARRQGGPTAIAHASLCLSEALMRAGQHDEAGRHACNAADTFARCDHTRAQSARDLATYLIQRSTDDGDLVRGHDVLNEGNATAPAHPPYKG